MPNDRVTTALCQRWQSRKPLAAESRRPVNEAARRSRQLPGRGRVPSGVRLLLPLGILFVLVGCSGGPSAVHAPTLSPEEAGRQALAEYDTNKDGFLDAKELERCPALKSSLKAIDKNRD